MFSVKVESITLLSVDVNVLLISPISGEGLELQLPLLLGLQTRDVYHFAPSRVSQASPCSNSYLFNGIYFTMCVHVVTGSLSYCPSTNSIIPREFPRGFPLTATTTDCSMVSGFY